MKLLLLGDVVGKRTVAHLAARLGALRKELGADMVIANAENATDIRGLSADDAQTLLDRGADVLTGGNHTFQNNSLYKLLDDSPYLVRPLNAAAEAPGCGETVFDCMGTRVLVLNLLGMMGMESFASPFETVDRALRRNAGRYDFAVVDVHAESTAEKQALGYYLDGRAAVVFGTHTHVQTADERILPGGTAYITDLGMCGPENGILGTDKDVIIKRFTTGLPQRFTVADGKIRLCGALVEIQNGKAVSIRRFLE